jgi:hypothetical protein
MVTGNKTQEKENRLLSYEERDILGEVATKDPPFSQRAQALLAIDEGTTQAAAGQQAGLTKGQVRYWLTKFRKVRIAIFPEELLDQVQQEDADAPPSLAEPVASPDTPDLEQEEDEEEAQQEMLDVPEPAGPVDEAEAQQDDSPKAKKKAKKKPKKAKKSKKGKKPKKDEKTKKGQKSKKKTKKKKSKEVKGAKGKSSEKTKKKRKK